MFNIIELTGEILGMTLDNTDGTSRQNHALLCRPGDELVLVPLPAGATRSRAPVVAIVSARGDQLGQLPGGIAEAAGAIPGDVQSLSKRWMCRVVRVMREGARLRTIVRLEQRGQKTGSQNELDQIQHLIEAAEDFVTRRAVAG